MSALARLSRSRSKSPQHDPTAPSPKRKPLHERSHSETNSIAGSASTGPPPVKDDSDPVYSSSPFPRLPSHVLAPKDGSPFIFEDSTASRVTNENAGSPLPPSRRSSWRKGRSPPGSFKGRRSPRRSPRTSVDVSRSRPGSVASRHGRSDPRDMTQPLDELRRAYPPRTSSRVLSIVSAIESSSIKSQSPPQTPRTPRTRSRGSRASVASRRFEVGGLDAQSIVDGNAPVLGTPTGPLALPSPEQRSRPPSPILSSPIQIAAESKARTSRLFLDQPMSPSEEPATEQRAVSNEPRPTTSASARTSNRPRSSSAPGSPAETFLAQLIATGAIPHPSMDRPSMTTLHTDSSSLRQAIPSPLQLRRQPALSNLALARDSNGAEYSEARQSAADRQNNRVADDQMSITSFDAPSTRPGTPRHQIVVDPPPTGRWTPGRWESELEDNVPELRSHSLRTKKSWREANNGSQISLARSESVTSFQSVSSTGIPFYHFLNDSKTAWAKSYYRGEGALRLMTPPSVTMIRTMSMKSARSARSTVSPITPRSRHSRSASDSGADHTPDSASYAHEVFVPRIRPFRNQQREPQRRLPPLPIRSPDDDDYYTDVGVNDQVPSPIIVDTSSANGQRASSSHTRRSWRPHRESAEGRRYYGMEPLQSVHLPRPQSSMFDPAPALSPDRGNNERIAAWRPPSLEPENFFGIVNRQVFLFCLGFCLPFGKPNVSHSFLLHETNTMSAWMTASFLPIPVKPPILRDDPEVNPRRQSLADLNQLFTQQDVRRYQKARWWRLLNRAMSILGTFVIAAIVSSSPVVVPCPCITTREP